MQGEGNGQPRVILSRGKKKCGRVIKVKASKNYHAHEDLAKLDMVEIYYTGKNVELLMDSGVRKMLLNEEIWKRMQKMVGRHSLQM